MIPAQRLAAALSKTIPQKLDSVVESIQIGWWWTTSYPRTDLFEGQKGIQPEFKEGLDPVPKSSTVLSGREPGIRGPTCAPAESRSPSVEPSLHKRSSNSNSGRSVNINPEDSGTREAVSSYGSIVREPTSLNAGSSFFGEPANGALRDGNAAGSKGVTPEGVPAPGTVPDFLRSTHSGRRKSFDSEGSRNLRVNWAAGQPDRAASMEPEGEPCGRTESHLRGRSLSAQTEQALRQTLRKYLGQANPEIPTRFSAEADPGDPPVQESAGIYSSQTNAAMFTRSISETYPASLRRRQPFLGRDLPEGGAAGNPDGFSPHEAPCRYSSGSNPKEPTGVGLAGYASMESLHRYSSNSNSGETTGFGPAIIAAVENLHDYVASCSTVKAKSFTPAAAAKQRGAGSSYWAYRVSEQIGKHVDSFLVQEITQKRWTEDTFPTVASCPPEWRVNVPLSLPEATRIPRCLSDWSASKNPTMREGAFIPPCRPDASAGVKPMGETHPATQWPASEKEPWEAKKWSRIVNHSNGMRSPFVEPYWDLDSPVSIFWLPPLHSSLYSLALPSGPTNDRILTPLRISPSRLSGWAESVQLYTHFSPLSFS
jgi:hypothetical protein